MSGRIIMMALLPVLPSAAPLRGASAGIGFLASLVMVLGAMMAH